MSYYALSDEQKLVQHSARTFAETEVVKYIDVMEQTNRLPMELMKEAGELGFLGLLAPKRYGGSEMGMTAGLLVIEELAKVSPAFSMSLYVQMATMMGRTWPDEMAERFIKPAINGECVTPIVVTDPVGFTNQTEYPVFAVKTDDEWVLNGTRLFATNSGSASMFLASGYDQDHTPRMWCVPADTPGVEHSHVERKIGLNGQESGTSVFSDVHIPLSYECAASSDPIADVAALYGIIAVSTGCALGALEKTRKFLLERHNSGALLYDNPAISQKLAEQHAKLLVSRAGMYDLAAATEAGNPDPDVMRGVFACKSFICPMCLDIAVECMQLWGGLGVCEDAGLARYVRDATGMMIGDYPKSYHYKMLADISRQVPYC